MLSLWFVIRNGGARILSWRDRIPLDYGFAATVLDPLPAMFRAGYCAPLVSFTILGAWLGLALSGTWRFEPSWVDRAGQFVGLLWISVTLVHWLSDFVQFLP
jgi:hypothetical protein